VGLGGLEPPTSSLSGKRSNQAELQARNGYCEVARLPDESQCPKLSNYSTT